MPVQAAELPKTIVLKGDISRWHEEYRAGGAIKPGHLCKVHTDGTLLVHSAAGVISRVLFAKEDPLKQGATIDTAFAANDVVPSHFAQSGDLIYGWVAAGASAIGAGVNVTPHTDGTVKVTGATTDHIVGSAEEAIDNSGGGSPARIKIRVR